MGLKRISVAVLAFGSLVSCAMEEPLASTSPLVAKPASIIHQTSETDGVRLAVTMSRHNSLGSAILVDFELQNNSDVTIRCNHSSETGDIFMKLSTFRGERVPLTDLGKAEDIGSPYNFTHNMPFKLRPHEVRHWRYNLLDYFEVTQPGMYYLSVLRTVDGTDTDPNHGGEDEEVDVGPIRFYVAK